MATCHSTRVPTYEADLHEEHMAPGLLWFDFPVGSSAMLVKPVSPHPRSVRHLEVVFVNDPGMDAFSSMTGSKAWSSSWILPVDLDLLCGEPMP